MESFISQFWKVLAEKDWDLVDSLDTRLLKHGRRKRLQLSLVDGGPLIIATRGLPCTGKSERASTIANALRCTHLNLDDILTATDRSLSTSLPESTANTDQCLLHDASYEILTLPDGLHPAGSGPRRTPLIAIECRLAIKASWIRRLRARRERDALPSSPYAMKDLKNRSCDYDINDVPKLIINSQNGLAEEDMDEVVLQFILLQKRNLRPNCRPKWPLGNILQREAKHGGETESCVELPQNIKFPFHLHLLALSVLSYATENVTCIICNGTGDPGPIYRCWLCDDLYVYHECAKVPHEVRHHCHKHSLKLQTYKSSQNRNQFMCRACGINGDDISYGCAECKLKLHRFCTFHLPTHVEYRCPQRHPLVLTPPTKSRLVEYYCDICEEERHPEYWIYYCESCEYHAHIWTKIHPAKNYDCFHYEEDYVGEDDVIPGDVFIMMFGDKMGISC
ncbi:hypothetical protein CRG98_048266 [Punica granatum]|uniref:Phorbol-ester/DAG-type domain-containing protein n=1 Tax=Punica granatum TaxID=22663 RepID=A0A2I0HIL2_PUNGR|nr:hypothetical protein CRG98_048266 [Punica granatum]